MPCWSERGQLPDKFWHYRVTCSVPDALWLAGRATPGAIAWLLSQSGLTPSPTLDRIDIAANTPPRFRKHHPIEVFIQLVPQVPSGWHPSR